MFCVVIDLCDGATDSSRARCVDCFLPGYVGIYGDFIAAGSIMLHSMLWSDDRSLGWCFCSCSLLRHNVVESSRRHCRYMRIYVNYFYWCFCSSCLLDPGVIEKMLSLRTTGRAWDFYYALLWSLWRFHGASQRGGIQLYCDFISHFLSEDAWFADEWSEKLHLCTEEVYYLVVFEDSRSILCKTPNSLINQ